MLEIRTSRAHERKRDQLHLKYISSAKALRNIYFTYIRPRSTIFYYVQFPRYLLTCTAFIEWNGDGYALQHAIQTHTPAVKESFIIEDVDITLVRVWRRRIFLFVRIYRGILFPIGAAFRGGIRILLLPFILATTGHATATGCLSRSENDINLHPISLGIVEFPP